MTIGFTQQDLIGLQNRVQGSPRQAIAAPDRLLDLRDIFGILRRRLRIIAAAVAVALALAIAYILLVPQNYSATSVILIDPRQTRVISSEDVLSGIGSDRAAVESQVELIESSALAERIVDQLEPHGRPRIHLKHGTPLAGRHVLEARRAPPSRRTRWSRGFART